MLNNQLNKYTATVSYATVMTIYYTKPSVSRGLSGHDNFISMHQSHCAVSLCFLCSHQLAFTLLYTLQILIYRLTPSTIRCPLPNPLCPFLHPPQDQPGPELPVQLPVLS